MSGSNVTTPPDFTAQHSPLPWKWLPNEGQFIVDAKGNIVAEIPCQGCNPADGEFIVRHVNQVVTSSFTEQARQLLNHHYDYPSQKLQFKACLDDITTALSEAEQRGQAIGIERAREAVDRYNPVAEGYGGSTIEASGTRVRREIMALIKSLSPNPSYTDRVRNEAATAALEQAVQRVKAVEWFENTQNKHVLKYRDEVIAAIGDNKEDKTPSDAEKC